MIGIFSGNDLDLQSSHTKCLPIAVAIEALLKVRLSQPGKPQICLVSGWSDQMMVSSGGKGLLIEGFRYALVMLGHAGNKMICSFTNSLTLQLICKTRNRQKQSETHAYLVSNKQLVGHQPVLYGKEHAKSHLYVCVLFI